MKRITLSVLILLLILADGTVSSEAFFMPDENEVTEIARLYTLAGRTLPSSSYPVSRNTLIKWVDSLSAENLSDNLRIKLESFLDGIKLKEDSVTAELDWSASYEHFLRTEDESVNLAQDYLDQTPLAVFGGSFIDYDYGGVCLELFLKKEYSEYADNNFFESKTSNPVALENQIVSKGYAFFTNDFMELVFGRFQSHYGNPHFNSLMANKNLPFLDQIKLDMNIADFKLEYYVASLENRKAAGDIDPVGTDFDFGQNSIWTTMHRLYYSFDNFNMSLSEQSFLSRGNNQLYLGDFSPLSVLHNTWLSSINISIFLDFTWNIIPGLELYYQQGIDDINAEDAFGIADSGLPTIDSFIFGAYHTGDLYNLPYNLKLEIGQTHYLWGSYNADNPFEEAIYRVYLDGENILVPFSSPYGPGAFWIEFVSEVITDFGLSGGLIFNFLSKNTLADLVTTDYERADDLMENAPRDLRFEFGAEINYNVFNRLDFYINPSVMYKYTKDFDGLKTDKNTWFECTIGGTFSGNEVFESFKN